MVHYDNGDVHVLLSGAGYAESAFSISLSSFKVIFLQDYLLHSFWKGFKQQFPTFLTLGSSISLCGESGRAENGEDALNYYKSLFTNSTLQNCQLEFLH